MPYVPANITSDNLFSGPAEIYVNNVLMGATLGGITLAVNTEYGEKTADQSPLLHGSYIKKQRGSLKFKLSDLTLDNMKRIFATVSGTAGAGNRTILGTYEIKLVGSGPNDTVRTITIWKGRFSGNTSAGYQIGEQMAFDMEIFFEADTSKNNGLQYFDVADV